MHTISSYQTAKGRKFILSVLAIVCILLSSCAVKAGIRNFLSKDGQTIQFNSNKKHTQLLQAGIICSGADAVNESTEQFSSRTVVVAALVATVITGIICLVLNMPATASSRLQHTALRQGLPIFLKYRRLII